MGCYQLTIHLFEKKTLNLLYFSSYHILYCILNALFYDYLYCKNITCNDTDFHLEIKGFFRRSEIAFFLFKSLSILQLASRFAKCKGSKMSNSSSKFTVYSSKYTISTIYIKILYKSRTHCDYTSSKWTLIIIELKGCFMIKDYIAWAKQ